MSEQLLAKVIKKLGSPNDVASRLGVSSQAVWNWQHGYPMSPQNQRLLRRLAEEEQVRV